MAPVPISDSAAGIDLSPRLVVTTTFTGAPGGSAETAYAFLTVPLDLPLIRGVIVFAFTAMQAATSSTTTQARLRRDDANGSLLVAGGAITETPGARFTRRLLTVDTAPVGNAQVYALTSEAVGAVAASPVFKVALVAIVV